MGDIYEITVKNYPIEIRGGVTHVSMCLDPLFDAKLLLEGVGVLIGQIVEWVATHPEELEENRWDMKREDVIKMLHDYLNLVGADYKKTAMIIDFHPRPETRDGEKE